MAHLRFAAPVEQRVALITGGARGIGGATALRLAEAGRHIVIVDVLAEPAQERVQEIEAMGQQALFVETDVTDEGQIHEAVAQTMTAFGRLDILVCSAGILGWEKPFFEQTAAQFAKVMQINVHGVYYAHQAAVPHMLALRDDFFGWAPRQSLSGAVLGVQGGGVVVYSGAGRCLAAAGGVRQRRRAGPGADRYGRAAL
ncbi:MAG: SDR family NAD(P)-dependent oxidoreductase [Candidatus Latescibacteria bacterium]|nr:SDR family NAD(P)-dependent oxidoreductase [Candidatus Latescibacterota bacterium]